MVGQTWIHRRDVQKMRCCGYRLRSLLLLGAVVGLFAAGQKAILSAQGAAVLNLGDIPTVFTFGMPIGAPNAALNLYTNESWNLDLLTIASYDSVGGNAGYPKIRFNNSGSDNNRWHLATSFNSNQWITNPQSPTGDPGVYSLSGGCKEGQQVFHPGEDWNLLSGGNSDLGAPVLAVANGRVLFSGWAFGNTVMLVHRTRAGEYVASFYGHLRYAAGLIPGQYVRQGDVIGFVGTSGADTLAAHLHFEIRRQSMLAIDTAGGTLTLDEGANYWPPCWFADNGQAFIHANYYNPSNFLKSHARSPIAGKWSVSPSDAIGWFRNARGANTFYLPGWPLTLGQPGDVPIVGDWDGDGLDDVGLFRPREDGSDQSTFYLDAGNNGIIDSVVPFPFFPQDIPVAGDWDQDGNDDIGGYDPATSTFHLYRLAGNTATPYRTISLGIAGDHPIIGDWDGAAGDEVGVFRPRDPTVGTNNFYFDMGLTGASAEYSLSSFGLGGYGDIGDWPLIGNWDGDGDDNIGVYRPSTGAFYPAASVPNLNATSQLSISCGTPVSADMVQSDQDLWGFDGDAGDQVWVSVTATAGSWFSPQVGVYRPNNAGLATTVYSGVPTTITLSDTGRYTLRVYDSGGDAGSYRLRLEWLGPTAKQCTTQWLGCGTPVTNGLDTSDQDLWGFDGDAGDKVWVSVTATAGSWFSPQVGVYRPDGGLATTVYSGAPATLTLSDTGRYTLRVYDSGGDAGSYRLRLEWLAPTAKQCTTQWLGCGTPITNALDTSDQDLWGFGSTAGDIVWVSVAATAGSWFSPQVGVYRPDGGLATTVYSGAPATLTLSDTGRYTLRVYDSGGDAGSYRLEIQSTGACLLAPSVPTGLRAGGGFGTQVLVQWDTVSGATSYLVYRRAPGGAFALIHASTTTSFNDTSAVSDTAYLYRVRAVNPGGTSGDSAYDLATTVMFADDPLIPGVTIVNALHLSQLRTGVNAVRVQANLLPATFTEAANPGVVVRALHIAELRTALDAARSALGLATGGYTDAIAAGVPIRAVHFHEIRDRIR